MRGIIWCIRLTVRTLGFHPRNRSSILLCTTNLKKCVMIDNLFIMGINVPSVLVALSVVTMTGLYLYGIVLFIIFNLKKTSKV